MVDVLHAADLGMTAGIIGNILWESVAKRYWGASNQEGNVALLAKDLDGWYKRTKCKVRLQGKLTKERLRAVGKFPKLKSKAAAARSALYAYMRVTPPWQDPGTSKRPVITLHTFDRLYHGACANIQVTLPKTD